MGYVSTERFRTLHALRIKGFAKSEIVAEVAGLRCEIVDGHLDELRASELAMFREQRALWQLTPAGREAHQLELAADVAAAGLGETLAASYRPFLELNGTFKALCGDWQLRDGQPNDHTDPVYDRGVIDRLLELDAVTQPLVDEMSRLLIRLEPYGPRLVRARDRLVGGQTNMFTGVMCGSYHDVWMELHEDLILTQGIDRNAEGSF